MQLYALDKEKRLISASQAQKQYNYLCIECGSQVRMRGGLHRQDHFYHLEAERPCKLSQKTMQHLQVQYFIQNALPKNDCLLECRFPTIGRIADVLWISQKIIFEVQCSFISAEEVIKRIKDYRSLGFEVIWILHEERFNQYRLTAAERILFASHPYYYTNINVRGEGFIYDQWSFYEEGIKKREFGLHPIDISSPSRSFKLKNLSKKIPLFLKDRLAFWLVAFQGDLIDLYLTNPTQIDEEIFFSSNIEEKNVVKLFNKKNPHKFVSNLFFNLIIRPYKLLFQLFLERACR